MTAQGNVKLASGDLCRSELSTRESAAWDGFLRTHAVMHRISDARIQRKAGVTIKESEVMLLLARHEHLRMRMSGLADAINLSASGTTRLVERLERRGLVSRMPCPSDGRVSYAILTEDGVAFSNDVETVLADTVREYFLSHLSDDDLDRMIAFWSRLLDAAGTEDVAESGTGVLAAPAGGD